MSKMPEAALVAAQAYLLTTQPTPGDPRESMHQAALQGLELVGNRLQHREEATRQNMSPCHRNSPQCDGGTRRSRSPYEEVSPHCRNNPRHNEGTRRSRSSHDDESPWRHSPQHGGASQRSRSPQWHYDNSREGDARNTITQARVNRSHYEWDECNYEDEEAKMGAACFTRRVRRMQVPTGFKLPHDQQKYDGSHEPKSWLSDYL
jgi:hypothetical protein